MIINSQEGMVDQLILVDSATLGRSRSAFGSFRDGFGIIRISFNVSRS